MVLGRRLVFGYLDTAGGLEAVFVPGARRTL